ncbi:MAG TPA: N-6 DNA methylase [Armatimonadota bacterium]|jgi:hypothetical protein
MSKSSPVSEPPQLTAPPEARAAVARLVARFHDHADHYRSASYNEADTRTEFIDQFFAALGWDIANKQGFAENYKEVERESSLKVGHAMQAPDYSFRIGDHRKFFVEAKKPSLSIKDDQGAALQLRRYGWSAKLPLSILTDFEEFAVYDCRPRPKATDAAAVARVLFFKYDQYLDNLDLLWSLFSKEGILKGGFDRWAHDARKHRGTAEVDDAFLAEIEEWRRLLAVDMAKRNPSLTVAELNFAVQATIDRILFLRIAEDRGVENYGRLQTIAKAKAEVYPALIDLFAESDAKYNAGLFDFRKDALSLRLVVSDGVLRPILTGLYPPACPYEFSVLDAHILGAVYEQFLGKVIRLTAGHQAKVDEKPEVKKAGGVYYTPAYIVDYIVEHTVGEALAAAGTPEAAAQLRILDPACGSGSFLLGAYERLLGWHLDYYLHHDPAAHARGKHAVLVHAGDDDWRLTIAERKRILLNGLYGVDIDRQAVEVTKLNLLLKCLEGVAGQTEQARLLSHDRLLPNIDANIKCGNSLIGSDYFAGRIAIDDEEHQRVNPFDWEAGFPSIMKAGGFDCVIGNPPYGADLTQDESQALRLRFSAASQALDTYALFMEQAVRLCRVGGFISMIVSTGWYSGAAFSALRRFIASATDPVLFVNLPYDVFNAWIDTTVFALRKRDEVLTWPRTSPCAARLVTFPKKHTITSTADFGEGGEAEITQWFEDDADLFLTYADSDTTALMRRVERAGAPFSSVADIQRGVTPFHLTPTPTCDASRPAFNGTVRRYTLSRDEDRYIRFDDTLAEPKPARYFEGPRILMREMISRQFRLQAVKVGDGFVTNKSMQSILPAPGGPDLGYLLGVLNSRLLSWHFVHCSNIAQRDDFPKIVLKETRRLPIRTIDFSDPADVARHDRMVTLVEQMLDLHKRLPGARTPADKDLLQRRIDATDREIDALVYELYGLTPDEIATVEGAG